MVDASCPLLVRNLPGLDSLILCNSEANIANNSLSDVAIHSLIQLPYLDRLLIGKDTEIRRW